MFTGLIEGVGRVRRLARSGAAATLVVDAGVVAEGVKPGDSVAVNGACLTATAISGGVIEFDVSAETLRVSTVGRLRAGAGVNLERSLRAGDRLGGHFVLGHVDAVGEVVRLEETPGQWTLEVRLDRSLIGQIIPKGSIAVDGISLTIAGLTADTFRVAVIPTTLRETALKDRGPGDAVNIELDVIGKYVARLLGKFASQGGGLTQGFLADHGF